MNIELKSLVGEHTLDGVDRDTVKIKYYRTVYHDARVIRIRLDGKVYEAQEDPEDDYRSSLSYLRLLDGDHITNSFAPVKVIGRMRADTKCERSNTLELVDAVTGKVVLAVGTDNTDDYYPTCVMEFDPTAMSTNESTL